jgi:hypothetical protein
MAEAAYARVRERFTVDRMVADTLRVYRRVGRQPHIADVQER